MRHDEFIKNLPAERLKRAKNSINQLDKDVDYEVDSGIISEHFAAVAKELAEAKRRVEQLRQEIRLVYSLWWE